MPTPESVFNPGHLFWMLENGDQETRFSAWHRVTSGILGGSIEMNQSLVDRLLDLQEQEKDQKVRDAVHEAIAVAFAAMHKERPAGKPEAKAAPPPPPPPPESLAVAAPDGLGRWIWAPFRRPSVVLRVTDPRPARRRDEDAVIEIARLLSRIGHPHTRFHRVELKQFRPKVEELAQMEAICFVGRLNLYFPRPRDLLRWQAEDARFWFGEDTRPDDWPVGKLHPIYHRVLEGVGPYAEAIEYRAVDTDKDKRRTDYGLVQRYVVQMNSRHILVVLCAGCSALGTLAAARWAADDVFALDPSGGVLSLPPKCTADSRLEALVKVKAETTSPSLTWELAEVELLHLQVGDQVWHPEESKWEAAAPKTITLVYPAEQVPGIHSVREVWLDGRQAHMTDDSENFHLLVAVCQYAAARDGVVRIEDLVNNPAIWNDRPHEPVRNAAYVKGRLRRLKSLYFGRALCLGADKDHCRLTAQVRFHAVDRQPQRV